MSLLLSDHLVNDRTFVLSEAMVGILSGQDRRMRVGDVLRTTTELIAEGKTQDGAEPAGYEIGQWKNHFMCDDAPPHPVDGDMYFAWVSTDFWDCEPNLAFFTKEEFMELFADCCRNYVTSLPERREEFAEALAANGMTL